MIALFDSGSTRLHFGWWDSGSVIDPVSVSYPESLRSLPEVITGLLGNKSPDKAAACSVSSHWREPLFRTINDIVPGELYIAVTASDIELEIRYNIQSTYGIDRALAAYAAYRFFQDSCVVIDAGTAVTVDAVTHDGKVIGGYIFPGAQTLVNALSEQTDLPEIPVGYNDEGIGTSTELCISYGVAMGIAGAVTRLVTYAGEIAGGCGRVIITGGAAQPLIKLLPFDAVHKPFLVLEGLGLALDKLPKYA